jgi:N4-gp56 family major capsid protein
MKIFRVLFGLIIGAFGILAFLAPEVMGMGASSEGVTMATPAIVTLFSKDIQKNLFPKNEFYKNSKDDSKYLEGRTVVIPQSGALPGVVVNRTTLPATVSQRTDSSVNYDIDEFTTDPILVQDTEEIIVNYEKRKDILEDHIDTLNTRIANQFGWLWAPSGADNIIRTTGTARAASAPSATGNRLGASKNDWINAAILLDRMEIEREGRIAAIPAAMLGDILRIDDFVSMEKIGKANLVEGAIGRLCGFDILVRSSIVRFDNTATPVKKAVTAAGATTDNSGALFYHPKYVRRAEGKIKVYSNLDDPTFYGSVFSAAIRAGGRIARADQRGVIAMVETAA